MEHQQRVGYLQLETIESSICFSLTCECMDFVIVTFLSYLFFTFSSPLDCPDWNSFTVAANSRCCIFPGNYFSIGPSFCFSSIPASVESGERLLSSIEMYNRIICVKKKVRENSKINTHLFIHVNSQMSSIR